LLHERAQQGLDLVIGGHARHRDIGNSGCFARPCRRLPSRLARPGHAGGSGRVSTSSAVDMGACTVYDKHSINHPIDRTRCEIVQLTGRSQVDASKQEHASMKFGMQLHQDRGADAVLEEARLADGQRSPMRAFAPSAWPGRSRSMSHVPNRNVSRPTVHGLRYELRSATSFAQASFLYPDRWQRSRGSATRAATGQGLSSQLHPQTAVLGPYHSPLTRH
jgi:hypothetical protein